MIFLHIASGRHSYQASSAISANYPSTRQYNLALGLSGSCNRNSGLSGNRATYILHQCSKSHLCWNLQAWEHSIFHTHHIMIPIVSVSFRREWCVARKICLAQYITLAVFGFRNVKASRRHCGKIMAEFSSIAIPDCNPKNTHNQKERKPTCGWIAYHNDGVHGNIYKKCATPMFECYFLITADNFDIQNFQNQLLDGWA